MKTKENRTVPLRLKKLLTGAGGLAVCAALAKLLGALFRIPLTNIAGAEGIGLYQMVFPLYTVLLTVSSGGLSSAISKTVAGAFAKKDGARALKILKTAVLSLLALGGAGAVFLILFRHRIAAVQGNPKAAAAYLAIAPSLVFVAVIACLRGYFQGKGNMLPAGVSQIIEQAVKLIAGLFFASLLVGYGAEYAAAGAAIGVSASELAAMLVLLIQFAVSAQKSRKKSLIGVDYLQKRGLLRQNGSINRDGLTSEGITNDGLTSEGITNDGLTNGGITNDGLLKRGKAAAEFGLDVALDPLLLPLRQNDGGERDGENGENGENALNKSRAKTGEILKSIYRVAIPVTLGSLIMPLTQVIDSIMVINILTAAGMERAAATSLFGLVSGPISSLINMPVVIMLSVSIALLPKIAHLREKGESADAATASGIRFTMLLALPSAAVFMVFPRQIVGGLYSGGLSAGQLDICASLLRIESLSVFYVGIIQTATAVLQGADKPHRPAVNLLYGAAAKVLLTLVLLPLFGIKGCAAASAACYGTIALFDLYHMRKIVRPRLNFVKTLLLPLLGCGLLIAVSFFGLWILSPFMRPLFALGLGLVAGAAAYAGFLLVSRAVGLKEFYHSA